MQGWRRTIILFVAVAPPSIRERQYGAKGGEGYDAHEEKAEEAIVAHGCDYPLLIFEFGTIEMSQGKPRAVVLTVRTVP